jgi:hypothetical protein
MRGSCPGHDMPSPASARTFVCRWFAAGACIPGISDVDRLNRGPNEWLEPERAPRNCAFRRDLDRVAHVDFDDRCGARVSNRVNADAGFTA